MIRNRIELVPIVKKMVFTNINKNYINAIIYTHTKSEIKFLLFENAHPRTIEQCTKNDSKVSEDYKIIIAPYISSISAELCKKLGVGYMDYSGNCFISMEDIFISDTGHENLFPKKDKALNVFRSSSRVTSKVLRVLMKNIAKKWKLKELSDEVGCSIGLVSRVKEYICDQAWAEMTKDGLVLINPEGLIKAWSQAYVIPKENIFNAYTLSEPSEFEKEASNIIIKNNYLGCLTSFSGGARYAPVVRYSKVHLWVKREYLNSFIEKTELKPVDTGANVVIFVAEDDELFVDCRQIKGSVVASPVQTYLDLIQQKGRGEEMAEVILSKEILNVEG